MKPSIRFIAVFGIGLSFAACNHKDSTSSDVVPEGPPTSVQDPATPIEDAPGEGGGSNDQVETACFTPDRIGLYLDPTALSPVKSGEITLSLKLLGEDVSKESYREFKFDLELEESESLKSIQFSKGNQLNLYPSQVEKSKLRDGAYRVTVQIKNGKIFSRSGEVLQIKLKFKYNAYHHFQLIEVFSTNTQNQKRDLTVFNPQFIVEKNEFALTFTTSIKPLCEGVILGLGEPVE